MEFQFDSCEIFNGTDVKVDWSFCRCRCSFYRNAIYNQSITKKRNWQNCFFMKKELSLPMQLFCRTKLRKGKSIFYKKNGKNECKAGRR